MQEQANERERFWMRVLKSRMPNGCDRSNGGEGGIFSAWSTGERVFRVTFLVALAALRPELSSDERAEILNKLSKNPQNSSVAIGNAEYSSLLSTRANHYL